jgi:MFS family permease
LGDGFLWIGFPFGVYLGGILTDKIGYYKVQFWSLALTGNDVFVLQTIDSFLMFNIMIFLTSTISDAFRPANMTAVAHYSEPKDRTRSISLIRLSINAGWAVGPAIGGIVAIQIGYSWLFWLDGATCYDCSCIFPVVLEGSQQTTGF